MAAAKQVDPYTRNVPTMADEAWIRLADKVVLEVSDASGAWRQITGAEARDYVNAVAKGLIAQGITTGSRVGIMSRTRYEWTILDLAILSTGAIVVPVYDTSSHDQVSWITSDADVHLLFVESEEHLTLAQAVAVGESPLTDIRCIEQGALEDLAKAGKGITDAALATARAKAKSHDLATIIYTSGTTGRPKGVELSHLNMVTQIMGLNETHPEILTNGSRALQFMTLAHIFARVVQLVCLQAGTTLGYTPDAANLVRDFGTFKPTLIIAVPRVFEKVYNSAEQKAAAGGKVKIFRWAAKQSIDFSRAMDTEAGPGAMLKFRHKIAHKLVLSKLTALLGGSAIWAVSGGAPLGERLGHFYRGLGLTILEGYGLTENVGGATINRPHFERVGTVGTAVKGMDIKIADDGEILLHGDIVFTGYHHNPEATKEVIKKGWFHTGDLGAMDGDGYLSITGRKKEMIVTSGGKNVAPAVLEDRLRSHPIISQCVVVGDAKPFIGALVTLDADALPGWLTSHGAEPVPVAEAAKLDVVIAAVQSAVDRANEAVSRAESIRKFTILESDFTLDNGYLTPKMSIKRNVVVKDFTGEIEALYLQ